MKKTFYDCRSFKSNFCLINAIIGLIGQATAVILLMINGLLPFMVYLIPLCFGIICPISTIVGAASIKIYVYNVDHHEIIGYCGLVHIFLIVDEQVVKRIHTISFKTPTLTYKLDDKHLEFFHKRLKVNGELVRPKKV